MSRITHQAQLQLVGLDTRYPWAVNDNDQVTVAVFGSRQEAKGYADQDPDNLVFFDASGVRFSATAEGGV